MCTRVLGVVLLLALLATSDLTAAQPVAAQQGGADVVYHVVQPGEYVVSIARRYGVSPDVIIRANHLTPPYWIYPRQVLVIPLSNPTPGPTPGTCATRVVRRGDTLAGIGREYGVAWTAIAALNNLRAPYRIYPGLQLRIPCSGALRLTERDNGRTINLRAGQTLEALLAGNPTTGYQWQVAEVTSGVLHPLGDPVYTPSSSLIGAGGTYLFRFQGSPGRGTLRLVYRRSWETGVPPAQTFQVTVVVTP